MYDFIIFEHTGLKNHYIDLCTIGRMLHDCGYRIAIADVAGEKEACIGTTLPFISLKCDHRNYTSKNDFMKEVLRELSPLTKHFYVGSILSDTSLVWLKYVPKHQKVFLWALRSFFFTQYRRINISLSYPKDFVRSLCNVLLAKQHKNICFFVSDTTIRDEFIKLGIESFRIVIRQERICGMIRPVKISHNNPLCLLTIGALRPEKRIDLCIKALDSMENNDFHFTIAGKAYTIKGYDKSLEQLSKGKNYITRISSRLDEKQYNRLIDKCDYLILSDEKQPSCVTNGTMAEALLAGRPIIAPNYDPYKTIVEKYCVGILYEMYNIESLKEAFIKAKLTPSSYYSRGIESYQTDLLYDKVLRDFAIDLKTVLIRY